MPGPRFCSQIDTLGLSLTPRAWIFKNTLEECGGSLGKMTNSGAGAAKTEDEPGACYSTKKEEMLRNKTMGACQMTQEPT